MFFPAIIPGIQAIVGMVAKLVPALIKIVSTKLATFAKALEAFFTVLGLIGPGEKPEEIGDKALQAEQDGENPIKLENFDSHEKYIEELNKRKLDPEKSAKIPLDEKLHKGIEILMGLAIEKFGKPMGDLYPIMLANPEFYSNTTRMEGLGKAIANDKEALPNIVGYLSYGKDTAKNEAALEALFDIEKTVSPNATKQEILTTVENMRGKGDAK